MKTGDMIDQETETLLAACRRGEYALGMDLGHGKNLIFDMPAEAWEERWGARAPAYWRPLLALLLVAPFVGYLAGIACAFVVWKWYWALLTIPATVLMFPLFSGFPHPRPGRYVWPGVALWWLSAGYSWQYLPVAVFVTSKLASQSMYFLVGLWLREYALSHPIAFQEWVSAGFLRIEA